MTICAYVLLAALLVVSALLVWSHWDDDWYCPECGELMQQYHSQEQGRYSAHKHWPVASWVLKNIEVTDKDGRKLRVKKFRGQECPRCGIALLKISFGDPV